MFHWEIKDFGKQSSITGKAFEDGEKILCIVLKDTKNNEMIRFDLLASESSDWEQAKEAVILGKWSRVYSEETALTRKKKTLSRKFLFSLFDANENSSEEGLLKYLFAVSLERKRLLKSKPIKGEADTQIFIHVKTKRELIVPVVIPSVETVSKWSL